ncbi:PH domain-containing protein [Microbacterium sp. NPDC055665]
MIGRRGVSGRGTERIVVRGASGWWISGVLAALFAYLLIDAAIRAEWAIVLLSLPWMGFVLLVCWMLLIRPCLIVAPSTLSVVNVFRTHTIPWREVAALQVRYQLVVELTDGTTIRAWGSPTVQPRRDRDADVSAPNRSRAFVGVVEAIDRARDDVGRAPTGSDSRTVSIAWRPLLAIVLALALGVTTAGLLL